MFEFSSGIFFWTLINFCVVLFIIYKFALPSLFETVEAEDEKREALLKELSFNTEESKKLLLEYQNKLADIQQEAKQILDDAKKEREELKKKEVERLISEKQSVLSGLRKEADYEKKLLLDDVYANASEIITLSVKKLFKKELSIQDHESIILSNLTELEVLKPS